MYENANTETLEDVRKTLSVRSNKGEFPMAKAKLTAVKNREARRYVDWIRDALKSLQGQGKNQSGLAEHMGIAHVQISRLLSGQRAVKVSEIPVIAEYLGVPPPARQYPIVGDVGAGGAVSMLEWPGGEPEMVDGPDDLPFGSVAVTISGGSLGHGFDGWRAFYSDRREPFHQEWFKQLCVVGTADGRCLVKWVRKGASGYSLHSGTGEVEDGVDITWAAKVSDLRPPG